MVIKYKSATILKGLGKRVNPVPIFLRVWYDRNHDLWAIAIGKEKERNRANSVKDENLTGQAPMHKRRVRYSGTHPKTFQEKYKEQNRKSMAIQLRR